MKVSVIVLVYNSEKTIKRCMDSLLNQSYKDFELIIVNDCSTDKSIKMIEKYKDKRIKIVHNKKRKGIARSRNRGLNNSTGDLIFFTDSDCIPMLNWLEEGVKNIGKYDFITGWTLYENPYPTFKDRIVEGKGSFFTCNLGFKRKALDGVEGFDEKFAMYTEDKDVCFRILKKGGKNTFCDSMVVIHQTIFRNIGNELKRYIPYYCGKLWSELRHHKEDSIKFRIIRPGELVITLFPPLLLLTRSFRSFEDLKLLPFTWLGMLRGRAIMWKKCIEARKFYI